MQNKQLVLPLSIITPIDVARVIRELDTLDELLRQSELRGTSDPADIPRYSKMLDELLQANEANMSVPDDREALLQQMKGLQQQAPIIHMSFSNEPPARYVQRIAEWLRTHIHGGLLLRVGLQPNIGAGCVVRTANKSFDFSLRKFFESKHEFFMQSLHEVVSEDIVVATTDPGEVVAEPVAQPQAEPQQPVEEGVAEQQPVQAEQPAPQPETEQSPTEEKVEAA